MTATTGAGELTGDYVLDTARTRLGFVSRSLLVVKVRGRFEEFEGSARLDGDDPSRSVVRLTIRARSIRTDHEKRDEHLRGGDFLDADRHPLLTFSSTAVEPAGPRFRVTGDLTVRGVTSTVVLDLERTGTGTDPQGGLRLGFAARGTLDRRDWGITWGRGMIAGKVALELDVALVRRGPG